MIRTVVSYIFHITTVSGCEISIKIVFAFNYYAVNFNTVLINVLFIFDGYLDCSDNNSYVDATTVKMAMPEALQLSVGDVFFLPEA